MFVVLGGVAGHRLVFFQMCLFFRADFTFCSFCVLLLFLHLFLIHFYMCCPVLFQLALLEPPLVFPHHFYSAQFQLS